MKKRFDTPYDETQVDTDSCDWETLYRNECKNLADLKADLKHYYECNQILKDENAYLKARNEKLEAIVRAVETLCGGKILDD